MNTEENPSGTPLILAPAGSRDAFLAAVAAGADAVYCGLESFSARMAADNFSIEALASLSRLAEAKGIKVYVAFNSLIKEGEQATSAKMLDTLFRKARVHGLIVQDLAAAAFAGKLGFSGEIHLSTLGNAAFPAALDYVSELGIHQVVLPRELTIDEIQTMASRAPDNLGLEVFVHGALCYGVSGRCYWSSWFGGKSGLRGRCVQPCRRIYEQGDRRRRFFSCLDFSVDVLAKVLRGIDRVSAWKIEGRKKGPHYVYYTVMGYKLLRDHGADPQAKKAALSYLAYAMGRPSCHYNLLPQRVKNPVDHRAETGSGLFAGRIKSDKVPYFVTREDLIPGDLLRIGYEDEKGHRVQRVTRAVPGSGKFYLNKSARGKVAKGTGVFIVDRRDKHLDSMIHALAEEMAKTNQRKDRPSAGKLPAVLPRTKKIPAKGKARPPMEILLSRTFREKGKPAYASALWLSSPALERIGRKTAEKIWWWLPPVLFPEEEPEYRALLEQALAKGARRFVVNIVWQKSLFDRHMKGLKIWAGPFCNIANSETLHALKQQGFSGGIVSPELDRETFMALPQKSPIPLGVVIHGNWPLTVSRTAPDDLETDRLFKSARKENAWLSRPDGHFWIFPDWVLDLRSEQKALKQAGYTLFVSIKESVPAGIHMKKRQGLWNFHLNLV